MTPAGEHDGDLTPDAAIGGDAAVDVPGMSGAARHAPPDDGQGVRRHIVVPFRPRPVGERPADPPVIDSAPREAAAPDSIRPPDNDWPRPQPPPDPDRWNRQARRRPRSSLGSSLLEAGRPAAATAPQFAAAVLRSGSSPSAGNNALDQASGPEGELPPSYPPPDAQDRVPDNLVPPDWPSPWPPPHREPVPPPVSPGPLPHLDLTVDGLLPALAGTPSPAGERWEPEPPIRHQAGSRRARLAHILSGRISDEAHREAARPLTGLEAREISAWFGSNHVLDRVSLNMPPGQVTALIGPSGCGKSTFLRILNRMHELIPSAALAGEVLLDGSDIYDPKRKLTDARRQIGMVFQKPNPFPAMSIYDNVLAGLKLTGFRADQESRDDLVESCLAKAGLWKEVRNRLRDPGGGLSGGQQQRLCIARALAVQPRVLLMDEPCSALDPTSTRRVEETIMEIVSEVTIVIVTHNMQQAARVSRNCAFFLAEQGTPGVIVEQGDTDAIFGSPQDPRTADYVGGRFG